MDSDELSCWEGVRKSWMHWYSFGSLGIDYASLSSYVPGPLQSAIELMLENKEYYMFEVRSAHWQDPKYERAVM